MIFMKKKKRTFDMLVCSMLTDRARYEYRTDRNEREKWHSLITDTTKLSGLHFFRMQQKYVFAIQSPDECRNLNELKRFKKECGISGNHPFIKEAKERIKKSRSLWTN